MNTNRWIIAGLGALIVAVAVLAAGKPQDRITICHFPPNNPSNARTITVSQSSLPDHMNHGDLSGACPGTPFSRNPQ